MAFAVVGIQAHFSKTLLLFFIPQIFNFVLSCPQLFGLVPCPRHRVPRYESTQIPSLYIPYSHVPSFDPDTYLLHPSKAQFLKRPRRISTVVLQVLAGLGFTELTMLPDGTVLETTNLTLLNVLLLRLGPMREKRLTQVLIVVQVIYISSYSRRTTVVTDITDRSWEALLLLSFATAWHIWYMTVIAGSAYCMPIAWLYRPKTVTVGVQTA
jgi:hypothetical protein